MRDRVISLRLSVGVVSLCLIGLCGSGCRFFFSHVFVVRWGEVGVLGSSQGPILMTPTLAPAQPSWCHGQFYTLEGLSAQRSHLIRKHERRVQAQLSPPVTLAAASISVAALRNSGAADQQLELTTNEVF